MANKMLTQEEVWDDSALVQSWNEAYQEYLKYHSLAAKGEKVNIADLHTEKKLSNGGPSKSEPTTAKAVQNDAEIDLDSDVSAEDQVTAGAEVRPPIAGAAVGAMPQVLAATVQDEDMKNLMMSWYYAGYYTGLYEGKQQGYASAKQQLQGG